MIRPRGEHGQLVTMDMDSRFWVKVDRTGSWWERDGCWNWIGSKDRGGYGGFWNGQKLCRAHRWSFERFVGPIPEGLHLDHLCKNPGCVNPAHLEPVTPRTNALRSDSANAKNARKTHCIHGHPLSGENLAKWYKKGRRCKQCSVERQRRRAISVKAGLTPRTPSELAKLRPLALRLQSDSERKP